MLCPSNLPYESDLTWSANSFQTCRWNNWSIWESDS